MGKIKSFFEDDVKRSVLILAVSAVSLIASFVIGGDLPVDPAWVAIILCGVPILWDAATGLALRHDIKADVLVAIAIIASLALGEWFAAGEVALIMEIGGFLEDFSAAKAGKGIEALASMSPRTGRIVEGDELREVPVDEIVPGQVLRVLPGESVPVDGRVVSGETSIDQSVVTGESMPEDKSVGDPVYSGTINQMGAFEMVAEKTAGDSSFQRMVDMVSSADPEKTRMVRTADVWATRLVAIVLVLALATYAFTQDIYRTVTVMIVFCPCAFILATPTAVVASIGNLAKRGVLVRDGDALERMSQVGTVAFDKTGTVTVGRPRVVEFSPVGDADRVSSLAATAESGSGHPLAKAFLDYAKGNGIPYGKPDSFAMTAGHGIRAAKDGSDVVIGNGRLMGSLGVDVPADALQRADVLHDTGATVAFIAIDGAYAGYVAFSDTIRETARATVDELKGMGVDCMLLTGDNARAAKTMASDAGITDLRAECTPEDKVSTIEEIQAGGGKVCMVGDGVNDAPALKRSWVGVAMGATGTDIAADASDMVLVKDGLEALPHLVGISRRMMSKVRANIAFAMCWNFVAVALSMMAVLTPVTGAIVHNLGSVAVVVNSALLLIYSRKRSVPLSRGALPSAGGSLALLHVPVVHEYGFERLEVALLLELRADVLFDLLFPADLGEPLVGREGRVALHGEVELSGLHVGADVVQGVDEELAAAGLVVRHGLDGRAALLHALAVVSLEPVDLPLGAHQFSGLDDPLCVEPAVLFQILGVLAVVHAHEALQVPPVEVHRGERLPDVGPGLDGAELLQRLVGSRHGGVDHVLDPVPAVGLQPLRPQVLPEGGIELQVGFHRYYEAAVLGHARLQGSFEVVGFQATLQEFRFGELL